MVNLKNRFGSMLVVSALALILVFSAGVISYGEKETTREPGDGLSMLIVDRTGSFATSMGTEMLARNLTDQLSANVRAKREIPEEFGGKDPFDIVFVVSKRVPQVWVLTGFVPYKAPEDKRKALKGVHKLANKVYNREGSSREVVGIVDDLAPAAWASYLSRYGWLGRPERPQSN